MPEGLQLGVLYASAEKGRDTCVGSVVLVVGRAHRGAPPLFSAGVVVGWVTGICLPRDVPPCCEFGGSACPFGGFHGSCWWG